MKLYHKLEHERLVKRASSFECMWKDHLSEMIFHALLFNFYRHVLLINDAFLFGLIIERWMSSQLRILIQYNYKFDNQIYQNAYHYYWYHMVVDGNKSLGFSCTTWDLLNQSYPFVDQSYFLSMVPVPFVSLLFMNISQSEKHLIQSRLQSGQVGLI